jgi:uncharacterized protein (DUF305 family)
MRSIFSAVAAALLAVSVLSACGSSDHRPQPSASQSAEADHNAADVAFAGAMIPHHEQAVEMAQMVPTNTKSQKMVDLANQVIRSQTPEVQAFRGLLMQWQDGQDGGSASHGGMAMTGMVNQATMDRLRSLTGPAFDRLWLTSMIEHHRGAIAMAQDEVAHGKNPDATYLAKTIIREQQAEIDQMNQMLGAPGG